MPEQPNGATKRCPRCEHDLPLSSFSKDSRAKDGLRSRCRECCKQTRKPWAENMTPEQIQVRRDRALKWQQENRERARANNENARRRRPERNAAHTAVWNALQRGDLVKQPCEVCGHPKSQAHHDDYSKQLDAVWLCQRHHAEADVRRRARLRQENGGKLPEPVERVTVQDAARQLGISRSTLHKWEKRGLITAIRLPSGVRRFSPEEVARVARLRGITTTPA